MSFGRRDVYDRRGEPRTDILQRVSLVFGDKDTTITGLIRNISMSGLRFVADTPLNLPRHVTLVFGNDEQFECDVVREENGTEFGLKFSDLAAFGRSEAKESIDAVYQITKSRSPMDIYTMMERVEFFGDAELEAATRDYAAAYDHMIGLYRKRVFAQQA